ncbi:MAG: hypothetical protein DMF29_00290 [Verrucomicrobia bacterium]|nr:MAG: hypothetical protein DMF29_00290 [Verrucomicrobiota bacterium]
MDLSKTAEKAFESARDTSKQIITLSTGTIAFTVTFSKELSGLTPRGCWQTVFLLASWIAFLTSAVIGIWTQLALTEELEPAVPAAGQPKEPSINSRKITCPFQIQIVAFLVGILTVVIYGAIKIL